MSRRREESVAYGTESIAPVTIGTLPVFVAGLPSPKISASAYRQSIDGVHIMIGVGASVNAAQPAASSALVLGQNASAWGDGTIAIGEGAQAGTTGARLDAIAIGRGAVVNSDAAIRIGNTGVAGSLSIAIGWGTTTAGTRGVAMGLNAIAAQDSIAIGNGASTNGTTQGIAIGVGAVCVNTGVNHVSIAIGFGAQAGANNNSGAIAIGRGAIANNPGSFGALLAIGTNATANFADSIAIGNGAVTAAVNELVIASNAFPITIVTIRPGAAAPVRHRVGGNGAWTIRNLANDADRLTVDESAVADDIRLLLWDVTAGVLKRVSRGAAGSGGAGFRLLRVLD